ncbi:hypothetical protein K0M31_004217 [Melipona bicolor]|uniref:Uncharacterized protein n=1 Tax=Melipona bicolor TaxID=60889 RepID=A0AA40FWV0_9HYME|nr:hypothetical protein K0M31_004217 [Melipona bicolor]
MCTHFTKRHNLESDEIKVERCQRCQSSQTERSRAESNRIECGKDEENRDDYGTALMAGLSQGCGLWATGGRQADSRQQAASDRRQAAGIVGEQEAKRRTPNGSLRIRVRPSRAEPRRTVPTSTEPWAQDACLVTNTRTETSNYQTTFRVGHRSENESPREL